MTSPVRLLPLLLVNFIGTLGFSIVMPFLIFLVMRWGGNAFVYGVVGATYSAFQFIGAPILGRWSDRFGRKRVLLLSQGGTLLAWLLLLGAFFLPPEPLLEIDNAPLGRFTLTLPLLVLFLARATDGLTGGNVSVANAYLADITPEQERSANFGKMAVSSNLGFIVGPALAGLLGATVFGELLPVLLAVAISLVATLLIAFRLEESNPCALSARPDAESSIQLFGKESRDCIEHGRSLGAGEIVRLPGVAYVLGIHFLVMLAFNFFYVGFPVYVTQDLGWTVKQTGAFFAMLSVSMALVQGPVLSWASKRWDERRLAVAGSLALAASFVQFTSASAPAIYAGAALLAVGNGLLWPSVMAELSKRAGEHQGAVQGFSGSTGAMASILGLLAGGAVYRYAGAQVFLVSASVIVPVFLMSWRLSAPADARG